MKVKFLQFLFLLFMLLGSHISFAQTEVQKPTVLQVTEKPITVDGRTSQAFDISQPDGAFGYYGKKGEMFDVIVENKTRVPLVLHWHGLVDPNNEDGVPYVTQLPIPPGQNYHYKFKLQQSGTYWLHSHYKLQEQKLMAAPLIIADPAQPKEHEALMFIQDFTFDDPRKIFSDLRKNTESQTPASGRVPMSMPMEPTASTPSNQKMSMPMKDITDVKYAAYLTNHRTLQNPDIIRVTPGETVRLRIINASASSSYYIDLGKLTGTLIEVDGEPIKSIQGSRFQISIGNRLDIRIPIPQGEGAYPILALPEGTRQQTGLILATADAKIPILSEQTDKDNPILDYSQELKLSALQPYPKRPVQRSLVYNLGGDMKKYLWTMNGQAWPNITPYVVSPGERVELVFNNKSGMPHPMHFHGHVFQVTEINGKKFTGRKGDTIDVMPNSTTKVVFDTLHCHILYHAAGGMMTTINYKGYPEKFTKEQRKKGEELYNSPTFGK
jgi:FtsP/CotA-like multicopper oxidase with cupredoxin domain